MGLNHVVLLVWSITTFLMCVHGRPLDPLEYDDSENEMQKYFVTSTQWRPTEAPVMQTTAVSGQLGPMETTTGYKYRDIMFRLWQMFATFETSSNRVSAQPSPMETTTEYKYKDIISPYTEKVPVIWRTTKAPVTRTRAVSVQLSPMETTTKYTYKDTIAPYTLKVPTIHSIRHAAGTHYYTVNAGTNSHEKLMQEYRRNFGTSSNRVSAQPSPMGTTTEYKYKDIISPYTEKVPAIWRPTKAPVMRTTAVAAQLSPLETTTEYIYKDIIAPYTVEVPTLHSIRHAADTHYYKVYVETNSHEKLMQEYQRKF